LLVFLFDSDGQTIVLLDSIEQSEELILGKWLMGGLLEASVLLDDDGLVVHIKKE
jgi:hypothetical protein